MKFALIGRSIKHSRSPELYKKIISPTIQYDLLDFESQEELPSLEELSKKYVGVNITAPYKEHYVDQVLIEDPLIKSLHAINTISFAEKISATNTDFLAIERILLRFKEDYGNIKVVLLGSGAMARSTTFLLNKLMIPFTEKSRKNGDDMNDLDLGLIQDRDVQRLVINTCSRDYVFKGALSPDDIFWDFNYNFLPHQNTLKSFVKTYYDGQEMLQFQAEAAAQFWLSTNPKLKY